MLILQITPLLYRIQQSFAVAELRTLGLVRSLNIYARVAAQPVL